MECPRLGNLIGPQGRLPFLISIFAREQAFYFQVGCKYLEDRIHILQLVLDSLPWLAHSWPSVGNWWLGWVGSSAPYSTGLLVSNYCTGFLVSPCGMALGGCGHLPYVDSTGGRPSAHQTSALSHPAPPLAPVSWSPFQILSLIHADLLKWPLTAYTPCVVCFFFFHLTLELYCDSSHSTIK